MSPFTDYLLSTGHLSEVQLIAACVEQLEATPPLAAVVMHQGLLRPEDQFLVLKKQASEGLGYQQACVALGLWTDELCAAVDAAISAARPTLAQILLNKGLIPAAQLNMIQTVASLNRELLTTSRDAVRAEFNQLNQVLVDEYSLLFKTDDYQKILELGATLPLDPSLGRKQALDAILEQIQSAHRGVNFLGFKSVDGLLAAIVQVLEAMQATATNLSSGDQKVLQAGLELFWQLSPSNLNTTTPPLKRAS